MIILGITGSIGMGKTTIASMLKVLSIPIHDADLEVKLLLETNVLVKDKIKKEWPNVIVVKNNKEYIDKSKLSDVIFNNIKYKKKLESIIHPIISENRDKFLKKYSNKNIIVALDIPLLYETKLNEICNYIFLAYTSEKIQKERVLLRPYMTEDKFNLIKKSQWSDFKKIKKNPYLIMTSFGRSITFIIIIFYLTIIIIKEKVFKK